ncbi:MAG: glycosyltransferase family 4 protein, partial [Actinomycetota bacterium]|nr:glycosyltransferase family 4 protein [Actinomycetota bacterium]
IYAQPSASALGGTDVVVAVLAESLAASDAVEILHHGRNTTIDGLAAFSGTDLRGVRLRKVRPVSHVGGDSHNPLRRFREARYAGRELSAPYDLFITFTHDPPPFCHAPRGILVVEFPMFTPFHLIRSRSHGGLWDVGRRAYSLVEWKSRLAGYDLKIAISQYTRHWARRMWGIDTAIVYPPTPVPPSVHEKESLILSIGRFASGGHVKSQVEMVEAFKDLLPKEWHYVTAGALGEGAADLAYADKVRSAAFAGQIKVATNLDRADVSELYGRASLFWHAAGLGSADTSPESSEHFGISTVEAMSAGAVPIVINKGGQREIVEHGVSGFLWNTLDELREYTRLLAADEPLRLRMSNAARDRAELFSRSRFVSEFTRLVDSVRPGSSAARIKRASRSVEAPLH